MTRPWIPVFAAAFWLLSVPPPAAAVAVRVMAFGDSLTKGTGSTHGAGYRLAFYQKMREAGFEVDMLGTFHAGPKDIDRDHQGHQGQGVAKLDEVSFEAPDMAGVAVKVDSEYVQRVLSGIVKDQDLSRYVL